MDFDQQPFIVIWELTQACDLACRHCRAEARPARDPRELSREEGRRLLRQVRSLGSPLLVLSGGDPLRHSDLYDWIEYAVGLGLRVSLTPSATPLLDREALSRFKALGVARLALSLDASTAEDHDAFRGVQGSFDRTLDACGHALALGLPLQINTTLGPHNVGRIPELARLVGELGAVLWSVFFVVSVGRAVGLAGAGGLGPEDFERAFEDLQAVAEAAPFDIKTTEAPHFRRFQAQRGQAPGGAGGPMRSRAGIGDGRGFVFVSHTGEVFPSGFLPLSVGNVRQTDLGTLYRDSPLFKALRNPDFFRGKCGRCEYRRLCGGSRARAYADQGDPLGWDPACAYEP